MLSSRGKGGTQMKRQYIAGFVAAEAVLYAAFLILDLTGRGERTIWLKYAGILLCLAFALWYLRLLLEILRSLWCLQCFLLPESI